MKDFAKSIVCNAKIDDDYQKFIQKYGRPETKEEAKRLIELAKKEGIDKSYIDGMERGLYKFYNKTGNSKCGNGILDILKSEKPIKMKSSKGEIVTIDPDGTAVHQEKEGGQKLVEQYNSYKEAEEYYKNHGYVKVSNESLGEYMSKKPHVINEEKTGAEEFFKKLAKDGEERAEKDDKDIEKVGNALGKDIYQHKLDPNQYMVVDWDKDTVTIIVNGVVRDVIKNTDKVAYAVDHVYKRVNSMNKVGNAKDKNDKDLKVGDIVDVRGKKGKITKIIGDVIEVFYDNSGTYNPDRTDRHYADEATKVGNSKIGNETSDDKFAYVMREFDEGKLKTPDGKVVTDPAQAKAIAYSESKKAENGLARARNAIKK